MSEFIAEAQVLIQPNTAAFAASLRKQVEAAVIAAGPVAIPVVAAPVAGSASSTAALVAAQQQATSATLGLSEATGLETQALDLAAKAQIDAAAAAQLAGAAATAEATEIARLTVAENSAAVAFRKSEAVALAAVGTTGELAAARATLKAATASTTASELAFDAALATSSAGHKNAAAGALVEARSLEASAKAAFDSAAAHRVDAVATARDAATHGQAARGIAAETLSLTGLRGATLAASAPFLVGATSAIVFAKSIKAASDETEQINKTIEVFGSSAKTIEDFSKTTSVSLGISSEAALEAAGIFGNLFRSIHISEPVAADMSERLVKLAADLASFNNASPERTLEALRSGLVGQARPLRVFGIFISQARAQQEALIETGKKNVKQLTNAELVQARFNIILQDSTIAQGDFARTSDRLANQARILSAQLENTAVSIGNVLIPTVLLGVQDINLLIEAFRKLGGIKIHIPGTEGGSQSGLGLLDSKIKAIFGDRFSRDLKLSILFPGVGLTINNLELINAGLKRLLGVTDPATRSTKRLAEAAGGLGEASRDAAFGVGALVKSVDDLKQASQAAAGLEFGQLKIETGLTGGGRSAEEANIRAQIEQDKKIVTLTKSGTKARRDALLELKSDQDALVALEQQDAADAKNRAQKTKAAADARKQAADDAAKAQADATQAFIDSFSPRNQRLQNALSRAQVSGTAALQITLNKRILRADKEELAAIRDRIRHLHLHGEALKVAKAAIQALNQEIFDLRTAIIQLQSERKQAIVDARQSHLEAQLAIAETTKSTADDRRAEKALIAFDQVQIRRILAIKRRRRLTQDEAAQLDAYRVDLAQRKKALDDLNKQTKDTQKSAASLFFTFLQTQQGFAANLLGNLIPGFATSGLVGGSQAAGGDTGLRQVAGGFEQPRGAVESQAAVASSRDRGVRPVQVDTTNQLLRAILRSLQNLNGRTQHPEARHNRAVGSAILDTMGGVHGA